MGRPPAERRVARLAVLAVLAAGAAGDVLLRGVPLGVNLVPWTATALALLFAVARARARPVTVGAGVLAALALAFAACTAWRAAAALVALDLLTLGTVACALALAGARALAADHAALGDLRAAHRAHGEVTALRGAALAAPVLGIFALLLASADGAFSHLLGRAFAVDFGAATAHGLWTLAGAWAVAGFTAGALFADPGPEPAHDVARPPGWTSRIRGAEVCVALELVDALFLALGVVQLGWLFGGRAGAARVPRGGRAPRRARRRDDRLGRGSHAPLLGGVRAHRATVLRIGVHGVAPGRVRVDRGHPPARPARAVRVRRARAGVGVGGGPQRGQPRRAGGAGRRGPRRRRAAVRRGLPRLARGGRGARAGAGRRPPRPPAGGLCGAHASCAPPAVPGASGSEPGGG